jgi:hypothetical protein
MFRLCALGARGEVVTFKATIKDPSTRGQIYLRAKYSPGDCGEPVITIMLPEED